LASGGLGRPGFGGGFHFKHKRADILDRIIRIQFARRFFHKYFFIISDSRFLKKRHIFFLKCFCPMVFNLIRTVFLTASQFETLTVNTSQPGCHAKMFAPMVS